MPCWAILTIEDFREHQQKKRTLINEITHMQKANHTLSSYSYPLLLAHTLCSLHIPFAPTQQVYIVHDTN